MPRIQLEDQRDFLDYRPGSGSTIEISDIQVGTERGVGKGRELVNALVIEAETAGVGLVFAITRRGNAIAQEFYVAIGFRIVAHLIDFYRDEDLIEDGIMFGLDIDQE